MHKPPEPRSLLGKSDEDLIKAHLQAAESEVAKTSLGSTEAGCVILEADADRRARLVARAIELWIEDGFRDAGKVASVLLRGNQKDWTAARLAGAVAAASALNRSHEQFAAFNWFPHKPLISAVEKAAEREPLSPELRAALEKWKTAVSPRALTPGEERELGEAERITADDNANVPWSTVSNAWSAVERFTRIRTPLTEERKLIERISNLLSARGRAGAGEGKDVELHIDTTDAVGTVIAADCAKRGRAPARAWAALLNHARALTATTPSKKWSSEAARLVHTIDPNAFGLCVADWFNCVGKPAPNPRLTYAHALDPTLLNDCSVELLKGLSWCLVAAGRADLAPALGALAESCYKKIPNLGPRNIKVANAATAALAALAEPAAAAQLSRLRLRVRHPSARATVDKALTALSKNTGLTPETLAEMSIPAFGLDATGVRRESLGDYTAELRVADSRTLELRFTTAEGKVCGSVPAALKAGYSEEVKRLKREAKDASSMLAAQALRLERLLLDEPHWPLPIWRERYLDHPLVGTLARRLIWRLDDTLVIPHQGRLVNAGDCAVMPRQDATVTLWHPIRAQPAEILAWRQWLERHEVAQPFKQAHRELYLLTDAERQTRLYSNRFAGHILRQHQFAALCRQRGWDYQLHGDFDSGSTPTLDLPAHKVKAQFWVEPVANELSPQGIFLYLATDQVRLGRPLSEVAPIVFSEVMRDIDLFVGVASVAHDPAWYARPEPRRLRTYWENWSFGDLSETSLARKQVLESLLPKLRIAGQCSCKDKFLVVRGSLRTYKIHLGSANILMEPNDQYLCIVPDRPGRTPKPAANVFLPFEGDHTLSVILSKAFLLAEDAKIKDQTITRQITAR